jgi:DNA-3-methyladenine glycosylase
LGVEFYKRNTIQVAQELLGKILIVRRFPEYSLHASKAEVTAARIVETEAYSGDDPASHSARGETPRCSVMFGEPGVAYVYFIYGMYEMLNFVTEPKGFPGAVLIRGVEPILGEDLMEKRRNARCRKDLTRGPGKLCRAMGIQMSHNRESLQGPSLFVVHDGVTPLCISRSERIGIRFGKERLWRFFVAGNLFVSGTPSQLKGDPINKV